MADNKNAALGRRPYKDDVELSLIGFGAIVLMGYEQEEGNRLVAEFVEKGVNYFDVAPSYGDGEAEIKLGPALEPYRKDCFLACKTTERTAEKARFELDRSLERLKTDHFDLYQIHAITDLKEDVDAAFAKGGAMEVFLEAKKDGRVRYLGFSAHSIEAAFAALDRYDFDSVLFPLNFCCVQEGDFGLQILERAKEKGAARLALKGMARQIWQEEDPDRKVYDKCWYEPVTDAVKADLALRWTLDQPITAAIPPGELSLYRIALDSAMHYKRLTDEERNSVAAMAKGLEPIFPLAS
jgi:aryl-alcohol dehydrogenase-like predicted oxidoreductase